MFHKQNNADESNKNCKGEGNERSKGATLKLFILKILNLLLRVTNPLSLSPFLHLILQRVAGRLEHIPAETGQE